jgi:hypothetical protein
VFENKVLSKVFGLRVEKVTGTWRIIHSEEVHNIYASQIIVRLIKSRRMRWARHVARIGDMRNGYKIVV